MGPRCSRRAGPGEPSGAGRAERGPESRAGRERGGHRYRQGGGGSRLRPAPLPEGGASPQRGQPRASLRCHPRAPLRGKAERTPLGFLGAFAPGSGAGGDGGKAPCRPRRAAGDVAGGGAVLRTGGELGAVAERHPRDPPSCPAQEERPGQGARAPFRLLVSAEPGTEPGHGQRSRSRGRTGCAGAGSRRGYPGNGAAPLPIVCHLEPVTRAIKSGGRRRRSREKKKAATIRGRALPGAAGPLLGTSTPLCAG